MWGALFAEGVKAFTGGGSGPAAPSSSMLGGGSTFGFDNSGFTVATGGSKAGASVSGLVLAGGGLLALLIVWRLTRK